MDQLALFPDTAVTGSGKPAPWPTATPDPEPETSAVDTDQLTFDEAGEEEAA